MKQTKQLRLSGLGGSDIAAVLELNPYKSRWELWAEKTGLIEPEDLSDSDIIWFGNESEDLHARFFERRTGMRVQRVNVTQRLKGHKHLMAHPDRRIVGKREGLELKSTDAFGLKRFDWGTELTDEIPIHYLPQTHTYLTVMDWETIHVSVLVGRTIKVYRVPRSQAWSDKIVEAADTFWNDYVLPKREPDISFSRLVLDALKKVYRGVQADTIVYGDEHIADLVRQKDEYAKVVKAMRDKLDGIDAELLHFVKDAEYCMLPQDDRAVGDQCLKKIHVGATTIQTHTRDPYSYLRRIKTPKDVSEAATQQLLAAPHLQEIENGREGSSED